MEIEPKYFEHPDLSIRCIEWHALQKFVYDGNSKAIRESLSQYEQSWMLWLDTYGQKAKPTQREVMRAVNDGTHKSLEECYEAIAGLLKPRARGKALKDKKPRTAQAAFQREQLGDAFIENKSLITAARQCAFGLSEMRASEEDIAAKADELVVEHAENEPPSNEQRQTLIQFIQRQVDRHLKPDTVEAQIIDADDKNLYFMWGKIKRYCPKGDTIAWPTAMAAREAHCSKTNVQRIMKKLESLGAVTLTQKGKAGMSSHRASIYRRLV
jgi:hypothetical protein